MQLKIDDEGILVQLLSSSRAVASSILKNCMHGLKSGLCSSCKGHFLSYIKMGVPAVLSLQPIFCHGTRMSSSICILVFGDQTSGFDAGLRRLVQIRENSALVSFLEKAVYTLRNEASRLPASQREELPRFTSLETLLARLRELGPCPALDGALACMHHLACFIR